MSQMRYRISTVTSQRPRYPASNLALNQEGWQSSINCTYPQSLTIQFYIPIRTKKLHMLFHQYKIPKLIQVFVKLGGRSNYRKLGHVIPNDNSQSSFQQKQEKTLYFQFSCTHIRFVVHQNYKNDMNILNQVSIQDIIVAGDVLTHKEIAGIDLTQQESSQDEAVQSIEISHNQRTLEVQPAQQKRAPVKPIPNPSSPLFRQIYDKLQAQKEEAVAREEYSKASNLKSILVNFHNLQIQISRLEQEKAEALKNEDYDRCQRIKQQINKKKEVVQFQREQLLRDEEQFYSHNFYSRVVQKQVSPINEHKRKENTPRDMAKYKSPDLDRQPQPTPQSNSSYVNPDDRVLPALANKNKLNFQNLPLQTNQKRRQDVNPSAIPQQAPQNEYSSVKKQGMTDRQAQVSMANESNRIQLQPLQNKLRIVVERYFDFLPQQVWQFCCNKNWKGKLEALRVLKEKVLQIQTKDQFLGTLEMLSRIIVSKQAVVSIESLQLLGKLTEMNIKFTLQHLPYFVEEIMLELLNFLNDTNSKIKELAYMTYLHLPNISFLSLSAVIRELIKHKNKVKNDPKLSITKLQLMTLIVETYKDSEYNFKEIMNWIVQFMEDPNQKVRTTAGQLLVALAYLVNTQRIIKAVEDMKKPELLEVALNLMNSSIDHSKAQMDISKLSNQNSRLQQEFYGAEIGAKSNRNSAHKAPHIQPIYQLRSDSKERLEQSKNSKRESDNANFQLSYSRQSVYEQSLQNSKLNRLDGQGEIRVLEGYEEGEQAEQDNICTYCGQTFENEKDHYITECKVLAHCQACNSLIYLRDFTQHLLNQCDFSHHFKVCKKCGTAFRHDQMAEHIAKDTCKKKLGVNWERCQFCKVDVMGQDQFWIKHALQCSQLPDRTNFRQNNQSDIHDYDD